MLLPDYADIMLINMHAIHTSTPLCSLVITERNGTLLKMLHNRKFILFLSFQMMYCFSFFPPLYNYVLKPSYSSAKLKEIVVFFQPIKFPKCHLLK